MREGRGLQAEPSRFVPPANSCAVNGLKTRAAPRRLPEGATADFDGGVESQNVAPASAQVRHTRPFSGSSGANDGC